MNDLLARAGLQTEKKIELLGQQHPRARCCRRGHTIFAACGCNIRAHPSNAPVGDVMFDIQSGEHTRALAVKDLKAHETREVEFSLLGKISRTLIYKRTAIKAAY